MRTGFKVRITYANVASTLALFLALSTGTAYAASLVTSAGIKNSTILSEDIKGKPGTASVKAVNGTITTNDISGQPANAGNGTAYVNGTITQWDVKDGSLIGADVADGSIAGADVTNSSITGDDLQDGSVAGADVANSSITGDDLQDGSVAGADVTDNSIASADVAPLHGDIDIQDNTISTFDLADNSVDADEVLDFGLKNEDVGVLFAQVNSAGALDATEGGATASSRLNVGQYQVDFGRNVTACAAVASLGDAGTLTPGAGSVVTADRVNLPNMVFVSVRDLAGAQADRQFTLVVVC